MLKLFIWPGFLLLLIAQWLVPVQMIVKKNEILDKGTSYKFQTEPIDPTDPFMGKYIVLNFKMNSLKIAGTKTFAYGSKVYVRFSTDTKGFAKIISIDTIKPAITSYLETEISYVKTADHDHDSSTIYLDYPFSKFYMDEYKAPKAEKIYRERNIDSTMRVYALVKIYNGDAAVKDVYVNDSLINDVIKARK